MSRFFLIATALAGIMITSGARADGYGSPSPGYVAPTIQAPPAFHGGQVTDVPRPQPLPNVGAPGYPQVLIVPPRLLPHH